MKLILLLYKIALVFLQYEPLAERIVAILEQFLHDIEQHPTGTIRVPILPMVTPMRRPQAPVVHIDKLPLEQAVPGSQLEADLKALDSMAKGL